MSKKRLSYITYQAGDGANEAQPCPRPHPAEATRWRGMIGLGCGPSDTPRRDGHTESARSCGRLDPSVTRRSRQRSQRRLKLDNTWMPSSAATQRPGTRPSSKAWPRFTRRLTSTHMDGSGSRSKLHKLYRQVSSPKARSAPIQCGRMRVSQFTVPLLQAGQAKHKAMETARKMLDGAISGSVRASDI